MRFLCRPQAPFAECDMTPMIDMTFQLIAFFMVLLNFAEGDMDERIHLPSSELAKPGDIPLESPITLQLTKGGTVLLGGEEVPVARVGSYLQREKEYLVFRADKKEKAQAVAKATIIIRADADAKTGVVQELIKAAQKLGFEKFLLRARQEQGDLAP
jgi:biopolymer transport protein ExbD